MRKRVREGARLGAHESVRKGAREDIREGVHNYVRKGDREQYNQCTICQTAKYLSIYNRMGFNIIKKHLDAIIYLSNFGIKYLFH